MLYDAVSDLIPDYRTRDSNIKDALDVYIEHRLSTAREHNGDNGPTEGEADLSTQFPPDLLRRFEVYWKPRSSIKPVGLRSLKADQVLH